MAQHNAWREFPGCSAGRGKQEEASGLPELRIWGCKFSFTPSVGERKHSQGRAAERRDAQEEGSGDQLRVLDP